VDAWPGLGGHDMRQDIQLHITDMTDMRTAVSSLAEILGGVSFKVHSITLLVSDQYRYQLQELIEPLIG